MARLDHRLDLRLVGHPVRIEHARYSWHTQDIRIGLQQSVFQPCGHGVVLSAELAVVTCERVVVIHKRHRMFGQPCAEHTCALALGVVVRTYTVVQRIILRAEVKRHIVPRRIFQSLADNTRIAVPILHNRHICTGSGVVIVDMAVVETFAVVVAPTVEAHIVLEPLQIRAAHCLYLRIRMIPVACGGVVRFVAVTVIVGTGSLAAAVAGGGVAVHLVSLAYPRCFRIECTVIPEVHRCKRTPAVVPRHVVDHNVCHGACTFVMQGADQRAQVGFAAPVAVQIAVLLGYVSCATAGL